MNVGAPKHNQTKIKAPRKHLHLFKDKRELELITDLTIRVFATFNVESSTTTKEILQIKVIVTSEENKVRKVFIKALWKSDFILYNQNVSVAGRMVPSVTVKFEYSLAVVTPSFSELGMKTCDPTTSKYEI